MTCSQHYILDLQLCTLDSRPILKLGGWVFNIWPVPWYTKVKIETSAAHMFRRSDWVANKTIFTIILLTVRLWELCSSHTNYKWMFYETLMSHVLFWFIYFSVVGNFLNMIFDSTFWKWTPIGNILCKNCFSPIFFLVSKRRNCYKKYAWKTSNISEFGSKYLCLWAGKKIGFPTIGYLYQANKSRVTQDVKTYIQPKF